MNKNNLWKWFVGMVILAILAIIFVGIQSKENKSSDLKIGVIATLTGPGAYFGEGFVSGLQMAVKDINDSGGIRGNRVSLIVEDSGTDNSKALSAAKKLVEVDGVSVILGDSWNSTTLTIMPYTNSKKVIMISPVASLDSLSQDDYLFRIVPKTENFMKALSEYIGGQGIKSVAFARASGPFGEEHYQDFKKEFEKLGGVIVSDEQFDPKALDVRTELTKIKENKPSAIFDLHSSGPSVGLLIAQGNQLGIKTQYITTWSAENDALLKQYGKDIEGIIYPFMYNESDSTTTKQFTEEVRKEGKNNDYFIASGYDTLGIVTKAMNDSGYFAGDPLKKALLNIKDYDGKSGIFSFDQNGDVNRKIYIKTVKNGEFQTVH
ncbi:MAG: ABC transporter substrate-binding protein [bacterium]